MVMGGGGGGGGGHYSPLSRVKNNFLRWLAIWPCKHLKSNVSGSVFRFSVCIRGKLSSSERTRHSELSPPRKECK